MEVIHGSTVTENYQTSRVAGTGSQGCDTQGNYSEGVETRATPEGSLFGSSFLNQQYSGA